MRTMVKTETVEQIWSADLLDRRQDADFLYNFITGEISKRKSRGKRSSYSLNIDAQWGGGKSFFLERFGKQAVMRGHVVAYVNAWKDDHVGDPYIAIMAAIDRAFAPHVKKDGAVKTAWKTVKSNGGRIAIKAAGGAIRSLAKKHFDITADDILGADQSLVSEAAEAAIDGSIETGAAEIDKLFDRTLEALIGQFQKADKAIQTFREKLAGAVDALDKSGKKAPFFVLVDELDRCRPAYAVHLLERIKHLFEVDGVAFVFATNSQQLQHSIAGAYGQGFDGFTYLKRFFDRTYVFSEISPKRRVEELCSLIDTAKADVPYDDIVEFISSGFSAYDLNLRASEQILEMVEVTISAWPHEIPIEMLLLFPVCVSFYNCGIVDWQIARDKMPNSWLLGDTKWAFNVKDAFSIAASQFLEPVKFQQFVNSTGEGPIKSYLARAYGREFGSWETANEPSIQQEIGKLVANAGRLMQPGLGSQQPA
ncbi:P-loop NTPase fold protein [Rhizobium brockwellii]|uniref:KAP family P-loop NTPase fold protein n=1 Tax=Rhizobium brockwellii TaxID=3019932 RepID=UPI003F948AC5